jgi:hypothetical protein
MLLKNAALLKIELDRKMYHLPVRPFNLLQLVCCSN